MSKRNFILLIIILVVIVAAVFGFLYFRQGTGTAPLDGTGGTNFVSDFNPFGNSPTIPAATTPPTAVSGYQTSPASDAVRLKKISSMPIAGYTVYQKERLKDVPLPVAPAADSAGPTP